MDVGNVKIVGSVTDHIGQSGEVNKTILVFAEKLGKVEMTRVHGVMLKEYTTIWKMESWLQKLFQNIFEFKV